MNNMSAPATPSLRSAEIPSAHKTRSHAQSHRKSRIVRRRGRAKDGIESEDEFVREVGTDSETEDDPSSINSDSDTDTEPVSEEAVIDGRSRPLTPSTSDSPQSHNKEIPTRIDSTQPLFTHPATWEDMVTEENTNGPSALPVIDFADFAGDTLSNDHASRPHSRKSTDGSRDRPSLSETKESSKDDNDHHWRRSHSSTSKRLPGQSARQAYQQRLDSDPSFVPTVGGFWGHDERLLDKDLRSLSGWWRGRWQNRGRGRGSSVRGRGGHNQGPSPHDADVSGTPEELPPIERPWTHDGYEEMKRKEQRRTALHQQQHANQTRGLRGGFVAGGGSRGGLTRGGLVSSPSRSNPSRSNPVLAQGRIWYAMKPELMWTKQHEAFLFFDSSTKPRKGQGPSYRIKLPGSEIHVVQTGLGARKDTEWQWPRSEAKAQDANAYTIRIPKRTSTTETAIEPLTTVEEASLEEIFTVRPNLVTPIAIPMPSPADGSGSTAAAVVVEVPAPDEERGDTTVEQQSHLGKLTTDSQDADQARAAKTEEAVMKKPTPEQSAAKQADQRPTLPPLQTVFTPPPVTHPSPGYGAPYSYGPALPLGVALNAHGMPYEVASGRPVYLAPPMYTPRPMMPSHPGPVPFVPSHMHHPSISPDFLSQASSHTPPMNGFVDPSTRTPLFSLPRQTRIEIRAPTDEFDGKGSRKGQLRQPGTVTKPPGISSPLQSFEPSNQTHYPSLTRPSETGASSNGSEARVGQSANGDLGNQQHADRHMMSYLPYQPYYYPESYGYYPYMDMSQVGQYDMYTSDPRGAEGSVYY